MNRTPPIALACSLGFLLSAACGGADDGKPAASAAPVAPAVPTVAPAVTAAPAAPAGPSVPDFFQGPPKDDTKAYKGWVNRMYDYGFIIPTGWTSASLPGSGFLMHDPEQKAMIALDYVSPAELTLASLQDKAKMAPFQATELTEVTPPTLVDVGIKKFLAKAGLARGKLNGAPGHIYWMDLAGIQTHEGERGPYHFIVMTGLKDGVSEAAKSQAMSAIRSMTPMSGQAYWKR